MKMLLLVETRSLWSALCWKSGWTISRIDLEKNSTILFDVHDKVEEFISVLKIEWPNEFLLDACVINRAGLYKTEIIWTLFGVTEVSFAAVAQHDSVFMKVRQF